MPVTARLSKRFYDTFGDEIANDLVEWFNQVDATYRQELREQNDLNWGRVEARISASEARVLAQVRQEFGGLQQEFGSLRQQVDHLDARLSQEVTRLRADTQHDLTLLRTALQQEMTGLRSDLDVGMQRLRADLFKWLFLFWTGTALTVIGWSLRPR
jgi:hypothetical protein